MRQEYIRRGCPFEGQSEQDILQKAMNALKTLPGSKPATVLYSIHQTVIAGVDRYYLQNAATNSSQWLPQSVGLSLTCALSPPPP